MTNIVNSVAVDLIPTLRELAPLRVDEEEERRRRSRDEMTRVRGGIIEAPMNTAFVQKERYQAQGKDGYLENNHEVEGNTSRPPFKETVVFMLQVEYCGGA